MQLRRAEPRAKYSANQLSYWQAIRADIMEYNPQLGSAQSTRDDIVLQVTSSACNLIIQIISTFFSIG